MPPRPLSPSFMGVASLCSHMTRGPPVSIFEPRGNSGDLFRNRGSSPTKLWFSNTGWRQEGFPQAAGKSKQEVPERCGSIRLTAGLGSFRCSREPVCWNGCARLSGRLADATLSVWSRYYPIASSLGFTFSIWVSHVEPFCRAQQFRIVLACKVFSRGVTDLLFDADPAHREQR